MRARGQGLVAAAVAAVVVAGGLVLDRGLGVRAHTEANVPRVASGEWICPHGGDEGWRTTLFVANPGTTTVAARITTMDRRGPAPPRDVDVPPGSTVAVEVPSERLEAASAVEFFGGWVGAGWVSTDRDAENPAAEAEPCAVADDGTLYVADGAADEDHSTDVVVANPFEADAVVDLVLLAKDRPPIRDTDLTSVVVRAGRSRSIRLNPYVAGERVVGTVVTARVGRVAVAATVRIDGGGFRQLLGRSGPTDEAILPLARSTGQSELEVVRSAPEPAPFDATLLSTSAPRPAGNLVEQVIDGASAGVFPIVSEDPAAVHVAAQGGAPLVTGLRAVGPHDGAAIGSGAPAPRWVVLPAAADLPAEAQVVLVNAGSPDASVMVRLLTPDGPSSSTEVVVPAGRVTTVPSSIMDDAGGSAVLLIADRPIVAAAAATSLGKLGQAAYALAIGVPIP